MKSNIFLFAVSFLLMFGLVSCTNTNEQETPINDSTNQMDNTNNAAGTQLPGTPMDTVNDNGENLVGGDAVSPNETPGEASFTILGRNFEYDIKEMTVQEGDEVTITFRSVDGFHDFVIDEFDVQSERVETDGSTTVTFIADEAGTYEYYCSVGQHRANGMVGTLIVE